MPRTASIRLLASSPTAAGVVTGAGDDESDGSSDGVVDEEAGAAAAPRDSKCTRASKRYGNATAKESLKCVFHAPGDELRYDATTGTFINL